MKPILVDALHINMGGALMILNHFVNRLVVKNVDFVLLKDNRCPKLQSEERVGNLHLLSADNRTREKFYREHREEFHSVLCLGNVPPTIKMPVPVHTYIHNVSLLEIPPSYPFKWKMRSRLKRIYIKSYAKNTDTWIVQTNHTADLVKKYLPCKEKDVLIYPFYHIPEDINRTNFYERDDYVFIGEHTYAKGHEVLIDAWVKLSRMGFKNKLHLTVATHPVSDMIIEARKAGADIVNHGRISFSDVVGLYNRSKATVYPSLNESLGLGIVEAISAGCDIIGSDLPFLHSICEPAVTFDPHDSDSIVDAVLRYEQGGLKKSGLFITDRVEDLISLLLLYPNYNKNEFSTTCR